MAGGEHKAQPHAGRVCLQGLVDVLLQLGELNDFVDERRSVPSGHPELGEVGLRVVPSRELGMEARADLEQGAGVAVDLYRPACRRRDTAYQFQESAFTGAVAPNDTETRPRRTEMDTSSRAWCSVYLPPRLSPRTSSMRCCGRSYKR